MWKTGLALGLFFALSSTAHAAEQSAHWVSPQTLYITQPLGAKELCASTCVPLKAKGKIQQGYWKGAEVYSLAHLPPATLKNWLKGPLQVKGTQGQTGVQSAELLDQLYDYRGPLGPTFEAEKITLALWAPTAQKVSLKLYTPDLKPLKTFEMQAHSQGQWTSEIPRLFENHYYRYEVTVYHPQTGKVETHEVTDPYATSLSTNSSHAQLLDLQSERWKPPMWEALHIQNPAPEDMVIYELHTRDFSIQDPLTPAVHRGKYTAFTQAHSLGMTHLKQLARSGLTHVHLLPVFDVGSIEENPLLQRSIRINPAAPDSELPQFGIGKIRAQDGFNWGYDPFHYGAPEGSYATDPMGGQRVLEFRKMVQALKNQGLNTIMDVVYNHTHTSGLAPKSVLDKIVPEYYYRLDKKGAVQNTTCCPDTASERKMMQKMMVDTLVRWARDYKVSGFRFDLMGHHTRSNLKAVQQALSQLTLAKDGIDGSAIYLYGEGWKFGSLDAKMTEAAMHQRNASGTGIGTFNDRFRDSLRGGNFDHSTKSDQGFINGLYTWPNQLPDNKDTPKTPAAQKSLLLNYMDNVRLGLAGNLKNFRLQTAEGPVLKGKEILYRGSPGAGYTSDPAENILYISAHDNYALWDQITAKVPLKTPNELKTRMQILGLSAVLLGQGVPFLHAGSEILRSKSGDGDSYDSGDYFNALDWTYQSNGWGKGLPAAWRNQADWPFWRPRLQQVPAASRQDILQTLGATHRLLKVRKTYPLLRLKTARQIQQQVHFQNAVGLKQKPGVIDMLIRDPEDLDPRLTQMRVIFNATPNALPLRLDKNWKILPEMRQPMVLSINGKMETIPLLRSASGSIPAFSVQILYQAQS